MRDRTSPAKGFTLIELLVVITIIGILAGIALPNFMKAKNKAKEAEVRAAIHVIQTAIERYAVDNNDLYPAYLIGGSKEGWKNWHEWNDGTNATNKYVRDPLIEYAYIDAYPANPFVQDPAAVIQFANGGTQSTPGTGDPRFGFNGGEIGMVLDDPRYYARQSGDPDSVPLIETRNTLPVAGMNSGEFLDPYHYLFGGVYAPDGGWQKNVPMAGNFFYRAVPARSLSRTGTVADPDNVPLPDVGFAKNNKFYILGGYGAPETRGKDVIRLVGRDPDGNDIYYRSPPSSGVSIQFGIRGQGNAHGLPEVFGGGDATNGPSWPYTYHPDDPGNTDLIFGAPDGLWDGVIGVVTSSGLGESDF
ncbi:MAG TPA: type II secretion system protein [bacterium]|nr:type II secretion system protein [bacterium]